MVNGNAGISRTVPVLLLIMKKYSRRKVGSSNKFFCIDIYIRIYK